MDATIGAALITAGVTLLVGFGLHKGQVNIKVKVDGRLEAALEKIDRLEKMLAAYMGTNPPPPVAGQSGVPGGYPRDMSLKDFAKRTFAKVDAAVVRWETPQHKQQAFRFLRLVVVGVGAAYATGSALDTTAIVAVVETAFRQVFPT